MIKIESSLLNIEDWVEVAPAVYDSFDAHCIAMNAKEDHVLADNSQPRIGSFPT